MVKFTVGLIVGAIGTTAGLFLKWDIRQRQLERNAVPFGMTEPEPKRFRPIKHP